MGSSSTTQQSTPQPTANDTALQANELQLSNAALPGQIQNTLQSQNLQGDLFSGQPLPGYLNGIQNGVSQGQSMNEAQMGLQGLSTQFQGMGGLDSGSYAQAGANSYANTINANSQFNVQNLAQLMNLAAGGSYNNSQQVTSNNQMLGSQATALASSSGSTTATPSSMSMIGTGVGIAGTIVAAI